MTPPTTPVIDTPTPPATDTGSTTGMPAATGRREPSRPGWVGAVAVAAGAAILASLGTVGALNAFGSPADAATSSTSASASQSAPLVKGSTTAPNWVATAAAVKPSVVSVRVQTADGSGDEGSGVVLDTTGRVLTNNHVVAAGAGSGATISVVLQDGRTYKATIVGTDPSTDLAVLAVQQPPRDLVPATFADSSQVKVGDPVMAIGNPLGLSSTTTTGVVSALNRPVTTAAEAPQQQDPQQQAPQQQARSSRPRRAAPARLSRRASRSSPTRSRPTPRSTPATAAEPWSTPAAASSASRRRSPPSAPPRAARRAASASASPSPPTRRRTSRSS